jgi:hypothetical protein
MVCPRRSAKEGLFGRNVNSGRLPPALSLGQGLPSSTCRSSLQPGGPSEAKGSTPALPGLARCVLCDDISTYVCTRVSVYICISATIDICKFACGHLLCVSMYARMHVCMYVCMLYASACRPASWFCQSCLWVPWNEFSDVPQRTPRLLLRMTPQAASETTCQMLPQTTLRTLLRMNPGTAPQMTPWMIPWSTPRTTPRRTRWKIPGHLFSRFLG